MEEKIYESVYCVATLDSNRITQAEYNALPSFGKTLYYKLYRKGEIIEMDRAFQERLSETYSGRILTLREALLAVRKAVVIELRRIMGL
jgi:hypothetical protein